MKISVCSYNSLLNIYIQNKNIVYSIEALPWFSRHNIKFKALKNYSHPRFHVLKVAKHVSGVNSTMEFKTITTWKWSI
jgi:hypothetical protein